MEHSPLSQRPCNPAIMDTEQDQRTEKILDLTLEILHLLTGEGYMVVKMPGEHVNHRSGLYASDGFYGHGSHSVEKILKLTNTITRLLTGEVPIRFEDVTVYLSMEEWEYVERHKELYEDVLMVNKLSLNSLEEIFTEEEPKPGQSLKGASLMFTQDDSMPYVELNHSSIEKCAPTYFTSTDYKEESVNSVLYTCPVRSNTEFPSPCIKEEADICEVIITDTHSVSDPTYDYDEAGPQCCPVALGEDLNTSSAQSKHGEGIATSESGKSPPSTQDREGKSNCPSHETNPLVFKENCEQKKPFSCSECGKCFNLNRNLIKHRMVHTAEKPFKCIECGKCFKQSSHLLNHQKVHTGERPFKCEECGKCFSGYTALAYHKTNHTGEKPFKCDQCGKCFRLKQVLTSHQKIHTGEKPYKCLECGKCFSKEANLTVHRSVHTGERPHRCDDCGKCFRLKHFLISHQRIHTGEKPFKCDVCGKCFRIKFVLISHQRSHTGEKPFKCLQCEKYFAKESSLAVHQSVHTGEKPFTCSECGKSFRLKHILLRHQRIHTGEKIYPCSECGKCFNVKCALNAHQRVHTTKKQLHATNVGNVLP